MLPIIMATAQGPLNDLAPEIYSIIAGHLPLYATPPTLLALALTNRRISEIVLPLLCSRLILKNEKDAIRVLQKLVDNPSFGRVVRELHIMSELSDDTRRQDPPSNVIKRVEDIILKGYLPFIHTLGIYLLHGWYRHRQFRKDLSRQLREKCPRLRGLILKGFEASDVDTTWIEDSGVLEVPMSTFALNAIARISSSSDILLRHVTSLAPSLHTLDFSPGLFTSTLQEAGACPLFKIDLPLLRSLTFTFSYGVDTDLAMAFFERHPSLEYLSVALRDIGLDDLWFGSVLPQKFLPNLLHLRVGRDSQLLFHGLTMPSIGKLEERSTPRTHPQSANQSFYLRQCQCTNTLPLSIHSSEWTTKPQEPAYWPDIIVEQPVSNC